MDATRVTLVHDWLTGMRGGEKCLEPLARRWPQARLLTLLHRCGSVAPAIERLDIQPSFLNRLPGVARYYRYLLPLMPFASGWKVRDADLVVSLSHCIAKSARPPKGVPHVCYCFTPMRYAWHMKGSYFRRTGILGRFKAAAIDCLLARIRDWDDRDSRVIYPPVDTEFYTPAPVQREEFYLVVSALAPYKRFDLAVESCTRLDKKLVVIGSGQEAKKLQATAGPGVQFLGWQSDEAIRDHLRRAKALLFPGEEDFGIVPLEAQACGCPVIAFGRGGAMETVRSLGTANDPTGVFFEEQSAFTHTATTERFEREADRFDPRA